MSVGVFPLMQQFIIYSLCKGKVQKYYASLFSAFEYKLRGGR